jgi:hypothetical protein
MRPAELRAPTGAPSSCSPPDDAPLRRTAAGRPLRRDRLDPLDRAAAWMEGRGLVFFAALSVAYWGVTLVLAARKLMWNDELYTYYMAVLPTMRDVWQALLTGGEQTPPFFYLVTRGAFALFGTTHVSIRLPEMIGVWVMSACLLAFVARRATWYAALCAATFPLVTMTYHYAFEARAYGLVLGFGGVAIVCWQVAASNRHRALALAGLAASLSAALATHYYAVFLVAPLALAEAVRSLERRRLDLAMWLAFAAPAVVLALHLPLLRAGASYSGTFWAPPQWVNVPDFYDHLLAPAVVPVTVILVLAAVHATLRPTGATPAPAEEGRRVPLHEVALAIGFVAIPFASVLVAKLVTGAFTYRYALPAVIGFALLAGFATAGAFRRHAAMRLAVVLCLGGWFLLAQARELIYPTGFSMPVSRVSVERPAEWLRAGDYGDLPLVIADPHTLTVLSHYSAPDIRERIVYLADPARALEYLGHNSVERGMLDLLGPWFGMNIQPFEPFMAAHPRVLVYGDFIRLGFLNWMLPELQARGLHIELLNREGDNLFLLVSRPETTDGEGRAIAALAAQPAARDR